MKKNVHIWWGIALVATTFLLVCLSTYQEEDKKLEDVLVAEEGQKKSGISFDEILPGGPGKDGIPPLDNPQFLFSDEVTYLNQSDEGMGIIDDTGNTYFLPFRVLVWHEIVNMHINYQGRSDFPISVTYCPLCRTGIVYEGVVGGKDTTFGTSGKLWQSNLVMYDRQEREDDESLWSQVLGESIYGKKVGTKLSVYNASIVNYGVWKKEHPSTRVLSLDTGFQRDYSKDPYGPSYYQSKDIYFPVNYSDEVTHPKEIVLGLNIEGSYVAYKKEGLDVLQDTFNTHFISIEKKPDGNFVVLVDDAVHSYTEGFWFSWKSVHPSTLLK